MTRETLARIGADSLVIWRNSRGRPNALTLSCKSRPPCRPQKSGAAAAATNTGVAGANWQLT
jgi:hypothetical protein